MSQPLRLSVSEDSSRLAAPPVVSSVTTSARSPAVNFGFRAAPERPPHSAALSKYHSATFNNGPPWQPPDAHSGQLYYVAVSKGPWLENFRTSPEVLARVGRPIGGASQDDIVGPPRYTPPF